jgi:hypothetical protein
MTLIPLLLLAAAAQETELHVSLHGNDAATGTAEAPFRTLVRARDAARGFIRAGLRGDLIIRIHGGRHALAEPLVLGPEDSGTDAHRVIWSAAPGGTPVISGADHLQGWSRRADGRFERILDSDEKRGPVRNLYLPGVRLPRARTPDEGYHRIVKAGPDDRTSFTFEPGHVKAWPGLQAAELVFLHDWSISRVRLAGVDEEKRECRLRNPVGPGAKHYAMSAFEKTPRYFLENLPEFISRPGEWVHDPGTDRLLLLPPEGVDPERDEILLPRLRRLLEIKGSPERPVRRLIFRGLAFAHTEWRPPAAGYAAGQASFHEDRDHGEKAGHRAFVPPAVLVEEAVGCAFERCRFEQLGGGGIHLGRGAHENRIEDCTFTDIAANGVMVGLGSRQPPASRGNVVTRNLIERCGAIYFGAVGVWMGITEGSEVSRNVIRRLPYTGVSLGWIWNPDPSPARDNRVEFNHIHQVMQILSDGGGIYTLGRQPGSVLRGNHIHDVPLNAGRAESNGIFMDEGTTDVLVEENVVWNLEKSPIRFHRAGPNTLRRNRLVVPKASVPPFRYNNSSEKDKVFEGNETVEAAGFSPPPPLDAGPRP